MPLSLHHLRVFSAVAEHGGFSRAAVTLRLSQPAVSKAVRALERRLALELFDRSGRTPRLTDAGNLLARRARELFAVERAAEEELQALRGLERGVLRIAASTTIATYVLPALLARFRAAYPHVRLRVASANTRDVARMLLQRRVDIALVEGPVEHPRIIVQHWRDDELVLITPAGHPFASKRRMPAALLDGVPAIARESGSGTRAVAERALAERDVAMRTVLRLASTEAITQAVAAGLGVAIVSRAAAGDQLALGRIAIVPLADLRIRRAFTRLSLVGRAASSAATAFEAQLSAER